MPDIGVHASMGREVYKRLHMNMNINVFRFGLLGPDPFLFSLPHFYKYSSVMHRERTGDFLLEMARRCRSRDQFSYLAGFLCHYSLDSRTHPFIVKMAQDRYGNTVRGSFLHIAIEHRLDLIEGGSMSVPPYPPKEVTEFFGRSVEAIYGWKHATAMFRMGYRHMPAFYLFVRDRYGLMHKVFGRSNSSLSMVSHRSNACDDLDLSGFRPLLEQATDDAVSFIKCADSFIKGRIGKTELKNVLGNRSYI